MRGIPTAWRRQTTWWFCPHFPAGIQPCPAIKKLIFLNLCTRLQTSLALIVFSHYFKTHFAKMSPVYEQFVRFSLRYVLSYTIQYSKYQLSKENWNLMQQTRKYLTVCFLSRIQKNLSNVLPVLRTHCNNITSSCIILIIMVSYTVDMALIMSR
jgi:hypothetical protein